MIEFARLRKTALVTAIMLLGLIFVTPSAHAVDVLAPACGSGAGGSPVCDGDTTEVYGEQGVLTRIAQLIVQIVGAASVIMIIIGGFKYVTSNGDLGKVASAKSTVIYALIGLAVAVTSQAIILLVLRRL
jgi:hypothetical protein